MIGVRNGLNAIIAAGTLNILVLVFPSSADENPERVRLFGRTVVGSTGFCSMGWTTKDFKRHKEREKIYNSIEFWCRDNTYCLSEEYRLLFKNHPASYLVSFDDDSDFGILHPVSPINGESQRASLEILRRRPLLSKPPNDLPRRRGLLLRFSSWAMTVSLRTETHRDTTK